MDAMDHALDALDARIALLEAMAPQPRALVGAPPPIQSSMSKTEDASAAPRSPFRVFLSQTKDKQASTSSLTKLKTWRSVSHLILYRNKERFARLMT